MFNQSRPPLSTPILPQHVNDPAFNTDSNAAGSGLPSQSILQSIVRSDTEPNFMAGACSFFRPTMFRVSVVILNLVFGILRPLFSYTKRNKVVLILDLVFNIVFVNFISVLAWRREDRAPTEQRVTQAPIRDIQSILNPLLARDDAVSEGSAVYPRDSSQLHRRARAMSRNDDDDTIASSDYQSSETPDAHFRLGDMSDDESSSSIRPQDSTHAERFSSSPQPASRFFPTPMSVASLAVRQRSMSFSHTASDLGSNHGNADIGVEDEDDHRPLLPPTPNLQNRNASYRTQNSLLPSPTALSSSLPQPFPNHLSSALSTAQDSRSQPYNPASGFSADAEGFTDISPAPKWNPPLPSSPPPVLFQPPPSPPPPPAYIPPQKLVFHVYGNAKASINGVKHDNVEVHAWELAQVSYNGYSQDGKIENDQVDTGKEGGDAPVSKKMKGRRQAKRRHEEPGHPRRRLMAI